MLTTPFGEVLVTIDGRECAYTAEERRPLKPKFYTSLAVRPYRIRFRFCADGRPHQIACRIPHCQSDCGQFKESGENLYCQAFFKGDIKLSLGITADDVLFPKFFDYFGLYLSDGMAYDIQPITKSQDFLFGIAWADRVETHDLAWLGADPRDFSPRSPYVY